MVAIDVWNVETFDSELLALLTGHAQLIRSYFDRHAYIFHSYDLQQGLNRPTMRPSNAYADDFCRLAEQLETPMRALAVRAFHYTRITDAELEKLFVEGIHLSTHASLLSRLAALVESSDLSQSDADAVIEASPFKTQLALREGMFWATSRPYPSDYDGVEPLLQYWGGEVAHFHQNEPELLAKLAQIGTPRVIEVAAPLSATAHAFVAGQTVIEAFAKSIGCKLDCRDFDLYVRQPLSKTAVLRVLSKGELDYRNLGRSYPAGLAE